ncbi:MAG: aminodeoxychorismate synthase component I [Cyclobacteriaceae bacterium]
MIYQRAEAIPLLNKLYAEKIPFVCFTDFLAEKAWIKPTDEIQADELRYQFPNQSATPGTSGFKNDFSFDKKPISYENFKVAFDEVVHQLKIGNSYLTNLTFRTPVTTNLTLDEIFAQSQALYRIRYKNDFVVFSPETFVRIEKDKIYSYPMKGTIDASVPNAKDIIMEDHKEMSEHITIVDLIRNDLSQIASKVNVTKFRFVSELQTTYKKLLQVSSEIVGTLQNPQDLGNNLFSLLPAGSISGAPKKQTLEIIHNAEKASRNFFTGICGHFDGSIFDSGVMIRFIENEDGKLYFRSGGGITALSDPEKEYQEMIDKVYVQVS